LNEANEIFACDLNDFTRRGDANGDQRPAPAQQIQLAGELSRLMRDDDLLAVARPANALNFSADQDDEGVLGLALFVENVSALHRTTLSVRGDARHLFFRQLRKCCVGSRRCYQ